MKIKQTDLAELASRLIAERTRAMQALRKTRAMLEDRPANILLRAFGLRRDWDTADAMAVHRAAPDLFSFSDAALLTSPRIRDIIDAARDARRSHAEVVELSARTGICALIQAERLGVHV